MIEVKLLSHSKDILQTVAAAINQCYSATEASDLQKNLSNEKRSKLLKIVLSSGHLSTIEHAYFTFSVAGISRATSHQLVRHRIASFSQQSQRYVKFKNGNFPVIVPPKIKNNPKIKTKFLKKIAEIGKFYEEMCETGILPEDARYILPNCAETKLVVSMNARSLLNFFEHRLCLRAQWEIQILAQKMLKICQKLCPEIFQFAGPTCQTEKICWEGKMSCGKWKGIPNAELRSRT